MSIEQMTGRRTTSENDLHLTDEWQRLIREQRSFERQSNELKKKQTRSLSHRLLHRIFSLSLWCPSLCVPRKQLESLVRMIADERQLSFFVILVEQSKKVLRGQKYIAFIGTSSFVCDHHRYNLDHFFATIRELSGQSDRYARSFSSYNESEDLSLCPW